MVMLLMSEVVNHKFALFQTSTFSQKLNKNQLIKYLIFINQNVD